MKSFVNICDETKNKLGRQLQEKEKDFLIWMYNKHQDERGIQSKVDLYTNIPREKKLQY